MTTKANELTEEKPIYFYDADGSNEKWHFKFSVLAKYRYLLRNLILRDIKGRYKNSVLGILWSLLNPLGLMLVFTVVFTVMRGANIRAYPVFILVGLIPWNFFNASMNQGARSVISNGSLIKKVFFPRELLPTSAVLSNLVNFFFAFIMLVVFLYAFNLGLTIHALWVPAILLTQVIFTLGLVLLLGSIAVFYRDVFMVMEVVMLAWFFLTPVFYSLDSLAQSAEVMGVTFSPAQVMRWINPMASIIDGYRTVLWGTTNSSGPVGMDPAYLLRTFVTAVVIFIFGYWTFMRQEHKFGEKL